MASVADLEIIRFDQSWDKDGQVLLRYTAQRSHCGGPYKGISKTGRHAQWNAAAIFEVEYGKIRSFTKDWDQKTMQIQLGWAPARESDDPRWTSKALGSPEEARKRNR
ncbi:hypothetical protein FNAPI_8930 [Fusarium napiforme]|uniref:Uncharacterized protein n=1 Tax=Fusarium napiforme TaxID=42672 RepID=A0A8H5MZA7_9HYPO|nr:hypothetical protein FNAPI_8930 [Fusarium napiforme]